MGLIILAAFIAVPLIEIGLFVQVGGAIGLWPTLAVVLVTAMAGTALLRRQGLDALARVQQSMEKGEAPLEPVFDGFCLLAAGMLLLTPGFFTDAIGFALFIPPLRHALLGLIAARVQVHGHASAHHSGRNSAHVGDIIDGDWQDITDKPANSNRPQLPKDPKDGD